MYKCVKPLRFGLQDVPCGHCYQCQMRKRAEWDLRLREEARQNDSFFLTLTMDPEHYESPNVKRMQLFFKRLRNDGLKFKYYAVAEFGERSGRGHYHIILFVSKWSAILSNMHDIARTWTLGMTDIAYLNDAAIHYVTKWHVHPKYSKCNTKEQHGFHPAVEGTRFLFARSNIKGQFPALYQICWSCSSPLPLFPEETQHFCSGKCSFRNIVSEIS